MNYTVKRISKQAALLVMAVSLSVSTAAPTDEAALPTIKSRLLIVLKAYSMKTKQKAANFGHCFLGNNQYSREEIQMARAKAFVVFAMLGLSGVGIRWYLKKSTESTSGLDEKKKESSLPPDDPPDSKKGSDKGKKNDDSVGDSKDQPQKSSGSEIPIDATKGTEIIKEDPQGSNPGQQSLWERLTSPFQMYPKQD